MIAKGKAIAHGSQAIAYAMREGKMKELLYTNHIEGATPEQITKEMERVNRYAVRCKNKYIHFQIGIAPQDKETLKPSDLMKIARQFSNRMGLQDNQ